MLVLELSPLALLSLVALALWLRARKGRREALEKPPEKVHYTRLCPPHCIDPKDKCIFCGTKFKGAWALRSKLHTPNRARKL